MCNKRILSLFLIMLLILAGCGNKKTKNQNLSTLRITLSGLDGQGLSEDFIRKTLNELPGIEKINFDYLFDCLYVTYDSTKSSQASIIQAIQSIQADKYKILEIESAVSPQNPKLPPPPQEQEIGDDVNIYKNNV